MEYVLLINAEGEPGSGTPEQEAAMLAEFGKYSQALIDSGAHVAGDRLQPPAPRER